MIRLSLLLSFLPAALLAAPYERPIPQAQSATAEFWFAVASLGLILALALVHKLVHRR